MSTVEKLLQEYNAANKRVQENLRRLDEAEAAEADSDDQLILKLNTIRSGRSFKDDDIAKQLTVYLSKLKEQEKSLLVSFLDGISQIVTGSVSADQATSPSDSGVEVVANKGKIRTIKPNIVRPVEAGSTDKPAVEDTAAPAATPPSKANPIQVKQR